MAISKTKYYTGVGSRETPPVILKLMEVIGEVLCNLGWKGRSGLAPGADRAFYTGAQRSPWFEVIGFENYLPNDWYFNRYKFGFIKPNPEKEIFDARKFTTVYRKASELALDARGSWNGLVESGIELHTRNAFQVMGQDLATPSRFTVLWAKPVGRLGKVEGGTNTANVISQKQGIEVLNLFEPEALRKMWLMVLKNKDALTNQSKQLVEEIRKPVEDILG